MRRQFFALTLFAVTSVCHAKGVYQSDSAQQVPDHQQQGQSISRHVSREPDFSHHHEVWPGTDQQQDTEGPVEGAGKPDSHQRQFGLDSAVHSINPDDVDYGGLLARWRLQVVHDTILKAEYWGVTSEGVLIVALLLYIAWLRNQREERLRITVDIAHQLRNSRAFARFHANRVIRIHNELVGGLNDEYEKKLRGGEANTEIEDAALPLSAVGSADAIDAEMGPQSLHEVTPDGRTAGGDGHRIPQVDAMQFGIENLPTNLPSFRPRGKSLDGSISQVDVVETLAKANAAASAIEEKVQIPNEPEDQAAINRRLAAQVEALQQKNRALRNQLNQRREQEATGVPVVER